MKLYHFAHSSASYRVRIAAELKGIKLDFEVINLPEKEQLTAAYGQINPQRMVPCMELPSGERIGQSLAIIEYLDDTCPGPKLIPADPVARAQARSLCLLVSSEGQPFQAKIITRYLQGEFSLSDAQVNAWNTHWLNRALTPVDQFLAERPQQTQFTFGDEPGVVECFLVPQMRNLKRFNIDLPHLTNLFELERTCIALEPVKRAAPENYEA